MYNTVRMPEALIPILLKNDATVQVIKTTTLQREELLGIKFADFGQICHIFFKFGK